MELLQQNKTIIYIYYINNNRYMKFYNSDARWKNSYISQYKFTGLSTFTLYKKSRKFCNKGLCKSSYKYSFRNHP